LGKQTRRAGLAGAARPAKEVGMRRPPLAHGVEQRADGRLLTDEVGEGLRPPLAVERLRCHLRYPTVLPVRRFDERGATIRDCAQPRLRAYAYRRNTGALRVMSGEPDETCRRGASSL